MLHLRSAAVSVGVLAAIPAAAADRECASGKVTKVRIEERREGPAAGAPEGGSPADRRPASGGRLYYVTLRCGDDVYVGRFVEGGGFRPDEFQPNDTVRFRVKGVKLYLRAADGRELEGLAGSARPRVRPKAVSSPAR
jgi:hypothetical protein